VGGAYPPAYRKLRRVLDFVDPAGKAIRYLGRFRSRNCTSTITRPIAFAFGSSCENLPIILLEAMAAGLPIACSDRGPMPSVLGNGGVYFDPERAPSVADALERLFLDHELRARCAAEAFERASRFTWKRCAEQTMDFLGADRLHRARTRSTPNDLRQEPQWSCRNEPFPSLGHRYSDAVPEPPVRADGRDLSGLGLEFEVQFMAWSDPMRPWSYREGDLAYPHRVHAGGQPPSRGQLLSREPRVGLEPREASFGCRRRRRLGRRRPRWRPRSSCRRTRCACSNPKATWLRAATSRVPALWIKRNIIRRYDGYIGPGPRSRELLTLMDPATAARPFLEFPNVIDRSVFGDGVAALRPGA
jgi:hypothetical protein